MTEAPKIVSAIARVMAEVGAVGKSRKNASQGYQFRGVDDVVAHVQEVMAKCGVIVVPRVVEREREAVTTKAGGGMMSVRLLVEHTFYCEADGSSVVAVTLGEAMDTGDKASNKAMSAALKYALTETLLIPTYEVDRDTEEHSPQVAPPAPPRAPAPPLPARRPPTEEEVSDAKEIMRKAAGSSRGFMAPETIAEAQAVLRAAPPSPPSNVVPLNGPTPWEIRINEAETVQALAALGSALQREPEAVRNAARPVYTRRFTELSARVGK